MAKRKVKPYKYLTENRDGRLTLYSKGFETIKEAKEWYCNFGKALEQRFNRVLILDKRK